MTFATSTHQTARKPHRCAICRRGISVGTRHLKLVGKWQGDFYAERAHDDCYAMWSDMFDDFGDPIDGMPYDLTEVFESYSRDEVQVELDARRGVFPHAVNRVEFTMRKWLEPEGGE